jgi:hypothetical protein
VNITQVIIELEKIRGIYGNLDVAVSQECSGVSFVVAVVKPIRAEYAEVIAR